ncbi:serine hydrolase [Legionella septentrionalis]|uniref:serine hydrolase n=1 Tax=Legionella septentrionalis TaxID=2498109 RepID=UPI002278EAC5|nr:serine hydrolase [Legionella septentrionalis]
MELFLGGRSYNGIPFIYLQLALEKLTGGSLEALSQMHIFKPLGMKNSSFLRPDHHNVKNDIVVEENTKLFPINFDNLLSISCNSLHTTTSDYAALIKSWINDKTLTEAFQSQIEITKDYLPEEHPVKVGYISEDDKKRVAWGLGMGLEKDLKGNSTRAYHSGDMNEWRAWVAMNVEGKEKSAVIYFSNSHNGHILADDIISSNTTLNHALNYFFPTYGFARNFDELENNTNLHGIRPSVLKSQTNIEFKNEVKEKSDSEYKSPTPFSKINKLNNFSNE